MANGFEPLNQAGFGSLMQMLENLQRQGAAQTAQTGPMLHESLSSIADTIRRQGEIAKQREFAASQARAGDAARARQATVDWSRQRGENREDRGFRERMEQGRGGRAVPNYDKLIIDLEGKIAEGKPYGTDTSGLERELARLRGLRGDVAPQPPPAPPPAADPNAPKTYADVAAERQVKVARKADSDKARETLRSGVAADIEKMLLAATPEGDPRIAKAAGEKFGRIMSEEGEPLIMVSGRTQIPKSREGKLLNMALRLQTRGVPEQEIVRQVMAQAKMEHELGASSRAKQGLKPLPPFMGRAPGSVDLTPAEVFTFLRYMESTIR